jgi:hypothetical protein
MCVCPPPHVLRHLRYQLVTSQKSNTQKLDSLIEHAFPPRLWRCAPTGRQRAHSHRCPPAAWPPGSSPPLRRCEGPCGSRSPPSRGLRRTPTGASSTQRCLHRQGFLKVGYLRGRCVWTLKCRAERKSKFVELRDAPYFNRRFKYSTLPAQKEGIAQL